MVHGHIFKTCWLCDCEIPFEERFSGSISLLDTKSISYYSYLNMCLYNNKIRNTIECLVHPYN